MTKNKLKKVLIIKLGALGDVVHTTIIATAIKQTHPDWEVHFLTQRGLESVLQNHPHIDKVYTWQKRPKNSFKQYKRLLKILFNQRYDFVFNITSAIRNILISYLIFPKHIRHKKMRGNSWVEDYFLIAKSAIKDLELPERLYLGVEPNADEKINELLKDYPRPYFAFAPGGATNRSRQGRIWNIEKWKELTQKLKNKYGGTIFVCGSQIESEVHSQLEQDNVVILSGQFSIQESSVLLSKMDLMRSGETGPMHIASAHNITTLAILGSTSPDKIKPYGKSGHYISYDGDCKYCWEKQCKKLTQGQAYTPCMEGITSDMIMEKIEKENLV